MTKKGKPGQLKWFRPLLTLLISLLSTALYSQVKISGKVLESKTNKPIEGAAVQIKNGTGGSTTSAAGTFTVTVPNANATLIISSIGFSQKEIPLNGRTSIDVSLDDDAKTLDDVVAVGYQNVQRRKTSAAISTVKGRDIENTPFPTFDGMLQGRVAGLNILSASAEPGASGIVNIRGNSSIASNNGAAGATGVSAPLYVIDGVVFDVNDLRTGYGNSNPLASINPNDIETIDVLKDASASAIYGARAANGVIIVKTKRPKSGKPQFRFSTYAGISTRPAQKSVIIGAEERRLKMSLLQDQATYAQLQTLSPFLTDSLNPAFNNAVDWQGLFVKQNAITKNVDLNVAGLTETVAYRLSLNRYEEDGILYGYEIKRTTPRLYLSLKPAKNIEITNDLYVSLTKEQRGPGSGTQGNLFPYSIQNFPSSFWNVSDAVKEALRGRSARVRDDNRTTTINGNTRAIIKLTKDITFTSSLSYNFGFFRRDYLYDRTINPANRSDAQLQQTNYRRWELENYATWNKELGRNHNVTLLVGQGAEQQVNNGTSANANGIPFDAVQIINLVPSGPNLSVNTTFEDRSRASYFARGGYEFKGKYGVDLSFRRDASSRYSPGSRWGTFPAASARWTISDEPFFDRFKDIVSFMKIRGSYGVTGRDPGSYYAQYRLLGTGISYPGSSLGLGASGSVITYNGTTGVTPNYGSPAPASEITWERSPQMNIGLDMNFLKDRFTFTVDLYSRGSQALIFNIPVPVTTGYTSATNNFVDIVNRGVELTLTSNNLSARSKLKWQTTFNVAFNDNFVTKLPDGNRDFAYGPSFLSRTLTVGKPVYGFQVYDVPFVYPTVNDIPVDPLTGQRQRYFGTPFAAGDNAKRDINGDYIVDDFDKVQLGDPNTRVYGGLINNLSYGAFSVQILTTFISGRSVWNGYLSDKLAGATNSNPPIGWGTVSGPAAEFNGLNLWQKVGDQAQLGKLIGSQTDPWNISQSMFVEDASFIRIKTINLGYTLPQKFTQRLGLKMFRLYSVIDNLAIFSKANLPDPEAIGIDGFTTANGYPTPKKFTFGFDIQF